MRLIVMILSLWCLQLVVIGQELKPLESYEVSLIAYYKKYWIAEREEFRDLNKKPVYQYLPDVGFLWGFPNINFRLSNIWEYRHDKQLIERKLRSIDLSSELEMNSKLQELRIMYRKLEIQSGILVQERINDVLARKVYEIGKECCAKRECTPKDCLELDLLRQSEEQRLVNMDAELRVAILELEKMAKYELPSLKLRN